MTWALGVTVPLLKGSGTEDATAVERAAEQNLDAARYNSAFSITGEVYTTAQLYWDCLAQQQNIAILDTMMLRARAISDILDERLKGGELAPVEYKRSVAELRLRESDLEDGRQAYLANRDTLAAQLGGRRQGKTAGAGGRFPPSSGGTATSAACTSINWNSSP